MNGVRHEKYGESINGLPFSLGIDLERSPYNLTKEQNWHENIEIQFFTEGAGAVLINGKKYNVKKDDIVVVNSNALHYTFTDCRIKYTCIIISNEWLKRMNIDHNLLSFHSLIKSAEIKKLISDLTGIYLETKDILRVAKLNKHLTDILVNLVENHCDFISASPVQNKAFEAVTSTIEFIHNNFCQKFTLSEIAKYVLFDKYALCREFKKYTGQTIFEYANHYRSIKAKDFLSKGYTVSRTAELCGFENLSFFTRTFKKYIGNIPSKYKANARL